MTTTTLPLLISTLLLLVPPSSLSPSPLLGLDDSNVLKVSQQNTHPLFE
jgi:hypothetical protein